MKKQVTSFCDGASAAQLVLRELYGDIFKYDAYEIGEDPILVSKHHFPNMNHFGDVRNWRKNGFDNLPECFIFVAGTSCKQTSNAGTQVGFTTIEEPGVKPRKVKDLDTYILYDALGVKMTESCICFWESIWYMRVVKPKFFFFEIPPLAKEWYDVFEKEIGVKGIMIDAALVSGQSRKRLYFTNIPVNGQPEDLNILLSDMIPGATGYGKHSILNRKWKRNISDSSVSKMTGIRVNTNKEGKSYTLTCSGGQYILPDGSIHWYGRNHCEWLMGFPIGYTDIPGITLTAARHMMGNSWSIPVVMFIFGGLLEFINKENLVESHV